MTLVERPPKNPERFSLRKHQRSFAATVFALASETGSWLELHKLLRAAVPNVEGVKLDTYTEFNRVCRPLAHTPKMGVKQTLR